MLILNTLMFDVTKSQLVIIYSSAVFVFSIRAGWNVCWFAAKSVICRVLGSLLCGWEILVALHFLLPMSHLSGFPVLPTSLCLLSRHVYHNITAVYLTINSCSFNSKQLIFFRDLDGKLVIDHLFIVGLSSNLINCSGSIQRNVN